MTAAQPNPESSGGGRNLYLVEMLLGGGLLLLVVAILAGYYLPSGTRGHGGNIVTLTAANWRKEVIESKVPVVVDFWAEWCGPCRKLAPTIDELAEHYAVRVKVGKVNIDDEKEIAADYDIRQIPIVCIFNGGKEPRKVILGLTSKEHLVKEIESVLK